MTHVKRTWTNAGRKYTQNKEALYADIFAKMQWQDVRKGIILPFMPGNGIKEVIRQLKIPNVSHIAIAKKLAPERGGYYSIYGIRANYQNGKAQIYVLDVGTNLIVLASDFYPKVETPKKGEDNESTATPR